MSIFKQLDIDLREEMAELISENKYEVLIQRTSKLIRCKCFDEVYNEANPKCPICIGTGWLCRFERHKTFKQDFEATADALIRIPDGELHRSYKIFYFEHDMHPRVKDYIWEVGWKNNKPMQLKELYKIKEVSNQRGDSGKVEYQIALAIREPIDKNFKNHHIGKAWADLK